MYIVYDGIGKIQGRYSDLRVALNKMYDLEMLAFIINEVTGETVALNAMSYWHTY